MTKTIAAYDNDAFAKEFEATVVSVEADENSIKLVLDKTLFFPEQGGQTSDIGELAGLEVFDVQISDGVITHFCKKAGDAPAVGSVVDGHIDFKHRFNNMQQHTGEHIFTGLAHNIYGAENVGFHLSDNTVTLDLNVDLSEADIRELELRANQVIVDDVRVICSYPDARTLAETEYRSKKEIDGDIRLVEIEGVDICACCAPHVRTTGQVGLLKVVSFEKYKGGTRVYILCGFRALEDYNRVSAILADTKQVLSCKEEQIAGKVESLLTENKQTKYDMSKLQFDILLKQIEAYPPEISDVMIFTEGIDAKNLREGVNALVKNHTGLCGIFSGNDDAGYSFVVGSQTRDCGAIVAGLRELLGAKGGGSKQMAQGSVDATRSQIEGVL